MPDRKKVISKLEKEVQRTYSTKTTVFQNGAKVSEEINPHREPYIKIPIEMADEILALLKEQEEKYPVCEKCGKEIDHINTSVFNYDGTDSDYSIPITYCEENGCVSFTTSQEWTGYYLTDEEQKEDIRCPYCGKFPFDDSMEIEFYEPVEVMMWTSERSVDQDV